MNPHWNARFIDEITTSEVRELIFNIVEDVSYWHRKNVLKYVRRIFMMAVEDGVLQRKVFLKIKVKVPRSASYVHHTDDAKWCSTCQSHGHRGSFRA